jgi:predicted metal-dependent peptidase
MFNQESLTAQAAAKMVTDALINLLSHKPFYGTLAMRLTVQPMPKLPWLMAVDGKHLVYNPARIVDELRHEQLVGLIEHEVCHLALNHHNRRAGRDFKLWNKAADYAVNSILMEDHVTLPDNGLYDPAYKGMPAEEIYTALEQAQQQAGDQGDQGGSGQGDQDGQQQGPVSAEKSSTGSGNGQKGQPGQQGQLDSVVMDSDGSDESSEAEWKQAAIRAISAAEGAGGAPSGLKAAITEMIRPSLPWREVLRDFLTSASRDDYSYARPNRRYVAQGLYLPEARSEAAGTIVVAVDTSGSINKELLDTFISELKNVFTEVSYDELHIVFCASKVREAKSFLSDEPIELGDFKAGGGTRLQPVFDWVAENSEVPDALIYFTDLEIGPYKPTDPGYPVLWAAPRGWDTSHWAWKNPEFGEVLELSD